MSKIPLRCTFCGKESLNDIGNLSERPLDNVVTAEGFECPHCEWWEPVFFRTNSLSELLTRIERLPVGGKKYVSLMGKAIRKAYNLKKRWRREFLNGSSEYKNMAST